MVLVLLSSAPAALAGGSIGSAVSCADQNGLIGPCGTTIGKQLRTWSGWVPRGAPLESDEARSARTLPYRGVALSADGTVIAAGSDTKALETKAPSKSRRSFEGRGARRLVDDRVACL